MGLVKSCQERARTDKSVDKRCQSAIAEVQAASDPHSLDSFSKLAPGAPHPRTLALVLDLLI